MRLLLTFIIFILGGFYTFGDNNCCDQCCEYLRNCCKKGKEEVQEEFYLKKIKADNTGEIEKLVSTNWYDHKGKNASFFLYEKIDNMENLDLNNNDVIKVIKYKNGFSIDENFIPEKGNTQKWALFEIIYKKKGEEEEKETVYLYCSDIQSSGFHGIFDSCKQYISISVIVCNTFRVTNMSSMFSDCSSLTKLDLSKFNTKNVETMSAMFYNCSSLTKLNLSKINTEKVIDMTFMFSGCSSLTELDLPNFNADNVTNMGNMFFECSSLHTVTFNKKLNEGIKRQLEYLGLMDEVKEKGNKIILKKKQLT